LGKQIYMSANVLGSPGSNAVDGLIPYYSLSNRNFVLSTRRVAPYLTVDIGKNETVEIVRFFNPYVGMVCFH